MAKIPWDGLKTYALRGVLLHGQSDNLTAAALVAQTPELPTGSAVRWTVREPVGLPPNGATLYRRARRRLHPTIIAFKREETASGWLDISFVRVRDIDGAPVIVDTERGLRVDGILEIAFTRPVVEVRAVLATESDAPLQMIASHFPFPVAHGIAEVGKRSKYLRADIIDILQVRVEPGQTAWITMLDVIPLAEMVADGWERVLDVPTLGSDAQNSCCAADTSQPFCNPLDRNDATDGQVADAMATLFDSRVHAPNGVPLPMAQRQIDTGPTPTGSPTVTIPALTFLILSAVAPKVARAMGLLLDIKAARATSAGLWDYLLVGHWCPRRPISGSGTRLELGAMPPTEPTMLHTAGDLLIESPRLLDLSGIPERGLILHDDVVWIHFASPVQVVELELTGGVLEATAFAERRVVDWALSVERGRSTLCADEIHAVSLYGPGAVIRAIAYSEKDPALDDAPSANIGDIGFWMFAAREHPIPRKPEDVTLEAINDPTSHPEARAPGDPEMVLAAVSWNAEPLLDVVQWTEPPLAAQYLVTRSGVRSKKSTVVAGGNPPFVVLPSAESLATTETSFGVVPREHPRLLDRVMSGSTLVYGVRALDIFGRRSDEETSHATLLVDHTPPPPPDHVVATRHGNGAVEISWEWPGAAGDQDAVGFRIYWRAGGVRRWADGSVSAVQPPTAGAKTVVCDTSVRPYAVGAPQALTDSVVIISGDRFLVKTASQIGSGQTAMLRLELFCNPSTPNRLPLSGDSVRVFEPPPPPGRLIDPASFDGHVDVSDPAARAYTVAQPTWSTPDEFGRSYITVGVATYDAQGESMIAGPAQATQLSILPGPPPRPTITDESDVFAKRADVRGRSSYEFIAAATPGATYHVYRALDDALLRVDAAQRAADGTRSGAPQYPSPLAQQDFDVLSVAPPVAASLLSNRALHALANFSGSERAFEQLTSKPVTATGTTLTYVDDALPGTGANRYIYRQRAASLAGELGDFGWAYPPVHLWPQPPVRPTLARVVARGALVDVEWSPNPERAVDRYRIYAATNEQSASDERTMTLVAEVSAEDASGNDPNLGITVRAPQGARYWFRVTAVATYPAPVNQVASAPSASVAVVPQTYGAPAVPTATDVTFQLVNNPSSNELHVTFDADDNPTSLYQLRRRSPGSEVPAIAITEWTAAVGVATTVSLVFPALTAVPATATPTVMLIDIAPPSSRMGAEYVMACTNETGRISLSDPLIFTTP